VEKLYSHDLKLDDINSGFDRLTKAEAVRQLIRF
jgi:Zn-dependent alcohol dehydrogenase